MQLVVWTGPVAEFQIPEATLRGADRKFINCTGDGAKTGRPDCPNIGEQLMTAPDLLFTRLKVDEAQVGEVYWGAFSAGGSLVKRCLLDEDYRKRTAAVHLADATYTSAWVDSGSRMPPAIEGFTQFAVDVARGRGEKLFIATASPVPNGQWASGIENLRSIQAEVEKRTGQAFSRRSNFFGITPEPEEVWQLGNVIFAYYPPAPLGHGHTKIAGKVWQGPIQRWVDKGKGPIDSPQGLPVVGPGPGHQEPRPSIINTLGGDEMLIAGGAALFAFFLFRLITR